MEKLDVKNLWTLEHYSKVRSGFRKEIIEHKKNRRVALGDNICLIFEDEKTIRYQVQEMLRIEKTFDQSGIEEELDAYNPLIPDGSNFKATMMIEYPDEVERKQKLRELKGIEDNVWVRVEGREKVFAIADEDLNRENDEKTSAVHFLRFELDEDMVKALKYGVSLAVGVDHSSYKVSLDPLAVDIKLSLVNDLG